MNKVFLSHNSKDKEHFVSIIAEKFGPDRCFYDEYTFRPGMKTLEEIYKALDKTDIFVLFISDTSLNSPWVKKEITQANLKTIEGSAVFFPIIIDRKIKYTDKRIPSVLRKNYNLQLITTPEIAYKIILQRLRQIIWLKHPLYDQRQNIFVGRNDLQRKIEERLDNLELSSLISIFAMGMKGIGRRALLMNSLVKATIIDKSYRPSEIILDRGESIEDFIVKVNSLGMTKKHDLKYLMHHTMEEKVKIATIITSEIVDHDEIIFIEDNSAIISYLNDRLCISDWFVQLLNRLEIKNRLCICLRSSLRTVNIPHIIKNVVLPINVPELSLAERSGLLSRYAVVRGLEVDKADLAYFKDFLSGFPEQIFFTIELIKQHGLSRAKNMTRLIIDFNTQKIMDIIEQYEKGSKELEIISFISRFDCISFDLLFKILKEQEIEENTVNILIEHSVCEIFGKNGEFVRINDTIKDYFIRQELIPNSKYDKSLREQIKIILDNENIYELDYSEIFISIRETLLDGKTVDDKYLIPSHYIKTVYELYHNKKRYTEVINLIDSVLERQTVNNLDQKVTQELNRYLCLSLVRLGEPRFFDVIKNVHGSDHEFLKGFYYRQKGDYVESVKHLSEATRLRKDFSMAKSELVLAYIGLEDYASGLSIAKENYDAHKTNPYNIQRYFSCLIRMPHASVTENTLKELIQNIEDIKTDLANEMLQVMAAQFESFYSRDYNTALSYIEVAINKYTDSYYPYLILFDIAEKIPDIDSMRKAINFLKNNTHKKTHKYRQFITRKSIFEAYNGDKKLAIRIIEEELGDMPQEYIERYKSYINGIPKIQ
jgi:tetratricopeptide (TPR) repeat protein